MTILSDLLGMAYGKHPSAEIELQAIEEIKKLRGQIIWSFNETIDGLPEYTQGDEPKGSHFTEMHDVVAAKECNNLITEIKKLRGAMADAKHQIELSQGGFARDILDKALYPACEHEWTDARNKVVMSGEICLKCNAVRVGAVS